MSLLLNYSTQFTRYSAEYRLFGHITEYSAKNEHFPNISIRPNIRKNLGAECSYSAETEIPVSFEHWLRARSPDVRYQHGKSYVIPATLLLVKQPRP